MARLLIVSGVRIYRDGLREALSKESSVDDLIRVLEGAVRGELECPADIAAALLRRVSELATQKRAKQTNPDLTPREWEVAHLIGDGFTNKEIASSLDIRVPTAKAHVHQVLAKLGARRRWEVVSRLPDAIAQNRCGKDASARPS